jgi:hypothetical protein
MKSTALLAIIAALVGLCAVTARAQDPAKTDPAHFKVEFENARVRVLRANVPPNTKIEVHELGDAVVVPLADYESTLKRPGGKSSTVERKTGKAAWLPAGGREFESGARGVEALLIEIKAAPAPQ